MSAAECLPARVPAHLLACWTGPHPCSLPLPLSPLWSHVCTARAAVSCALAALHLLCCWRVAWSQKSQRPRLLHCLGNGSGFHLGNMPVAQARAASAVGVWCTCSIGWIQGELRACTQPAWVAVRDMAHLLRAQRHVSHPSDPRAPGRSCQHGASSSSSSSSSSRLLMPCSPHSFPGPILLQPLQREHCTSVGPCNCPLSQHRLLSFHFHEGHMC
jgi:hypothetical protein